MLDKTHFPFGAIDIIRTLKGKGYPAFLVGGCVRDLLLGTLPDEWDITTSAKPEEVCKLFDKVIPTGIEYGTVTILLPDGQYEVTTFRSDEKYIDGRHPSNVRFTDDIHQDLSRRDFTINALAYDPIEKKLIDDFNGQKDLADKVIRAIGDPVERFSEDGLRSIRACRLAAKLGFTIEEKTFEAITKTLAVTQKVAPERVHDEIIKLLSAQKPSIGFDLMSKSGLLKIILPKLEDCRDVEQPPEFHKYDVYWHNLQACDAAPQNNPIVRLAALLHDIEKPSCKVDYTFYGHDQKGAETVKNVLQRLKFSNRDIDQVAGLIENHMFDYSSKWGDAAVRRFIRRAGLENIANLFALRIADTKAMEREIDSGYLAELQARIDKIIAEQNALHVKDLKVNGKDVMQTLNLSPGPEVGKVLTALLEKVLDNPALNEREKLLKMIRDV
ncbi:MAG: CCA tRNA nucleotidyltransferase [Candidatus Margulisbacteria bacterium]|nr:CCA tRNA nucleotidyltransferase [Candidatus Margulisiibacteriota bacterium]